MSATLQTPAHAAHPHAAHPHAAHRHTPHTRTPLPRATRASRPACPASHTAVLVIAAIWIQFLMVTAYAWSAASTAPRNVPIAITGPAERVAVVTGKIELAQPGAFRLVPAASPAAATADITSRRAYGAIVLTGTAVPKMLVAPAASPAVANILTTLAQHLDGTPAPAVSVIVPSSPADPDGTAFAFTVLPIAISSLTAGVLLTLGVRRRGHRVAALVAFSAGGGAASIAVAHTWLGILPGSFPMLATVAALGALAVAAGVSGLTGAGARFGSRQAGIAAGGALIMCVGNSFSAAGSAPDCCRARGARSGSACPTARSRRCSARWPTSTGSGPRARGSSSPPGPPPGCS